MKLLDIFKKEKPVPNEETIISVECPFCNRYTNTDIQFEENHSTEKACKYFCIWCGKEFIFYY